MILSTPFRMEHEFYLLKKKRRKNKKRSSVAIAVLISPLHQVKVLSAWFAVEQNKLSEMNHAYLYDHRNKLRVETICLNPLWTLIITNKRKLMQAFSVTLSLSLSLSKSAETRSKYLSSCHFSSFSERKIKRAFKQYKLVM